MPTEPRLAPPGAGLPFYERLAAKYWLVPRFCRATSWEKADAIFQKEGGKLLALADPLPPERLHQAVLIDRIPGIEDSSRHWSPEMVLEHLIMVGSQMKQGFVLLSRGETPTEKADVAAVKPKGSYGSGILPAFRTFLAEFAAASAGDVADRNSRTTYLHPWFGPLNAHQWHCLAAIHQAVHRKQMEKILAGSR